MKRRLLTVTIVLLSLILIGALIVTTGILVKPNFLTQDKLTEIPTYDILSWQAQRETQLTEEVSNDVEFNDPYVIVDPYQMNPLSAMVLFHAENEAHYTVTVLSPHPYAQVVFHFDKPSGFIQLPIIGLYPGITNQVKIEDGTQSVTLSIETEALPSDFQTLNLIESLPDSMEPGFTLFVACFDHSYTALIDQDGAVRAYFSNTTFAHGTSVILLENGHLLATGDELKQVPYNMTSLWELDWMGKVYQEIEIPNGIHHDLSLLPDGRILAASNNVNMFETGTREDVAILINLQTGMIEESIDFRTLLDEDRAPYNHFHPDILNALNIDWMHMNAAQYDAQHDSILVSSPTQSQVVSIDAQTHAIQWILGPHEGYEDSAFLTPYLLTPIGEDFQWAWAQHHPMIMKDLDQDPDTIDLMMLDNGQARNFTQAGSVAPEDNWSRAVHYRINLNDHTVEQLWAYGQERGTTLYATFLGDANALDNGNTLIAFGGQLRQNGIAVDSIVDGVLGQVQIQSRVVEVDANKNVVFEMEVLPSAQDTSAETYQAIRMDLSKVKILTSFGTPGIRKGEGRYSDADTQTKLPNFYFGDLSGSFNTLVKEDDRLIVDGNLFYKGEAQLLGQAVIVLRSWDKTYVFKSNSGLNGRYFANIDLSTLQPGLYELSIAGGVKEGNDVLGGTTHKGLFQTGYKLTLGS